MRNCLSHDHEVLDELFANLRNALEVGNVRRVHDTLDLFWARLAVHIRAEHLHLFPAMLQVLNDPADRDIQGLPSVAEAEETISSLRTDHDFFMHELSQAMISVRELLNETDRGKYAETLRTVSARVAAVETRLLNHNRIEENGIYAWTSELFSDAEERALGMSVTGELTKMPPRFCSAQV
jgi:iron-sulfur cluster repair protein YtfE (RIC family)